MVLDVPTDNSIQCPEISGPSPRDESGVPTCWERGIVPTARIQVGTILKKEISGRLLL